MYVYCGTVKYPGRMDVHRWEELLTTVTGPHISPIQESQGPEVTDDSFLQSWVEHSIPFPKLSLWTKRELFTQRSRDAVVGNLTAHGIGLETADTAWKVMRESVEESKIAVRSAICLKHRPQGSLITVVAPTHSRCLTLRNKVIELTEHGQPLTLDNNWRDFVGRVVGGLQEFSRSPGSEPPRVSFHGLTFKKFGELETRVTVEFTKMTPPGPGELASWMVEQFGEIPDLIAQEPAKWKLERAYMAIDDHAINVYSSGTFVMKENDPFSVCELSERLDSIISRAGSPSDIL